MTNSEFKAWFDGFTEAMDGIPSKRQWDRVKEQVKNIDVAPITRHYVDRYWPGGYPYAAQGMVGNNLAGAQGSNCAMYALGRLEASSADE